MADDGEVLVRSADLFEGYWNNAAATRELARPTRWLRTGDIGEWRDGGCAWSIARATSSSRRAARRISPSIIENMLRASPYIAEAVVFGHGRKYLTALIEIDSDTVADWARSHDVAYTGFTSLPAIRKCATLIEAEIEARQRGAGARRADQGLPHPAQGARPGRRGRAGDADAQGEAGS